MPEDVQPEANPAPPPQPQRAAVPPQTSQTLDLEAGIEKSSSADVEVPDSADTPRVQTARYDPQKTTDYARRWIGFTLLGLLIAIILIALLLLYLINSHALDVGTAAIAAIKINGGDATKVTPILEIITAESKANADRLSAVLNIVFGPVVTLLGSVIGFYFGTQSARSAAADSATQQQNGISS